MDLTRINQSKKLVTDELKKHQYDQKLLKEKLNQILKSSLSDPILLQMAQVGAYMSLLKDMGKRKDFLSKIRTSDFDKINEEISWMQIGEDDDIFSSSEEVANFLLDCNTHFLQLKHVCK